MADAGFIIMESSSYEGMSGTNTINTVAVLLGTGMVEMTEPVTHLTLEAPAGLVKVRADCAGGRVERIEFENVPSFATHLGAAVEVPGLGSLSVDVAYGGAFAAFVDAQALGFAIVPDEARDLADLGERIRPHVNQQLAIAHPLEPDLGYLSFVVFVAPPLDGGDARHATVVSPGAAGPLPHRHGDVGADGRARRSGAVGRALRGREHHRHALHGAARVPHDGRRARGDRPGDLRPRLDHRLPPARRRPDRPAGRGLQAARHLGRRAARGDAQPVNGPPDGRRRRSR